MVGSLLPGTIRLPGAPSPSQSLKVPEIRKNFSFLLKIKSKKPISTPSPIPHQEQTMLQPGRYDYYLSFQYIINGQPITAGNYDQYDLKMPTSKIALLLEIRKIHHKQICEELHLPPNKLPVVLFFDLDKVEDPQPQG